MMNMRLLYKITVLLITAMVMQNCSDNESENGTVKVGKAEVTLLVTPNGLGDNGMMTMPPTDCLRL